MLNILGNKPDYHLAMGPEQAKQFYHRFVQRVKENYKDPDAVQGKLVLIAIICSNQPNRRRIWCYDAS